MPNTIRLPKLFLGVAYLTYTHGINAKLQNNGILQGKRSIGIMFLSVLETVVQACYIKINATYSAMSFCFGMEAFDAMSGVFGASIANVFSEAVCPCLATSRQVALMPHTQ